MEVFWEHIGTKGPVDSGHEWPGSRHVRKLHCFQVGGDLPLLLLQLSPSIRMLYLYHVTTCYMLIMPGARSVMVILPQTR